jgi:hypothetical protein
MKFRQQAVAMKGGCCCSQHGMHGAGGACPMRRGRCEWAVQRRRYTTCEAHYPDSSRLVFSGAQTSMVVGLLVGLALTGAIWGEKRGGSLL